MKNMQELKIAAGQAGYGETVMACELAEEIISVLDVAAHRGRESMALYLAGWLSAELSAGTRDPRRKAR